MKRSLLNSLLIAAGLALGGAALADGTGPCAIATNVRADGTVELSNTGNAAKCDAPPAAPVITPGGTQANTAGSAPAGRLDTAVGGAPGNAPAGAPDPSAPSADAQSARAGQAKDPRESYRDAMLQGLPGTTAANPAVSRRYKMMNKETYQATGLDGGAQGSPAGSQAAAEPSQ
jgi:hypothetical protein